jgi:hypothetical protein
VRSRIVVISAPGLVGILVHFFERAAEPSSLAHMVIQLV